MDGIGDPNSSVLGSDERSLSDRKDGAHAREKQKRREKGKKWLGAKEEDRRPLRSQMATASTE